VAKILKNYSAILIPGGFGSRGTEGQIEAIAYARKYKVPFFGICFGMQMSLIESARNMIGMKKATSSDIGNGGSHVIGLMSEWIKGKTIQKGSKRDLGGTMRLGSFKAKLKKNTLISKIYKSTVINERHRHRYEVDKKLKPRFEKKGLIFSGLSPDGSLPETIELENHPWFIGVQFHPEFKSRPFAPHPLFSSFIKAAKKNSEKND
jgi:CTP synthase